MIPLLRFSVVALLILAPPLAQAQGAQQYFDGLGDVPIMPGLTLVEESAIDFDTPSGRFAEVFATGNVSENEVLDYYAPILAELGWLDESRANFVRAQDLETLVIEFFPADDDPSMTVRFTILPNTMARQ